MRIDSYTASNAGVVKGNPSAKSGDIAGRKYMNRVEKGEKVNLFQEAKNSVAVEISEEGIAQLNRNAMEIRNEDQDMVVLSYEEKVKLLNESAKSAGKLYRIIPNIQTNDKLRRSLQGADEKVVKGAYSIIENNLIPHNVGDLTEEQRREMIFVGLEEAKFLAKGLDEDKAILFMDAMNTIAKYGINGKTDGQGNVSYDIRWGAMVGAPDDYVSSGEFMKRIDPEKYENYVAMRDEAFARNDELLMQKAAKYRIDWEIDANRNNPKAFEDIRNEQVTWKMNVDNTKIESTYDHTDKSDIDSFMDSIMEQNMVLDGNFLQRSLQEFARILAGV